MGSEVVACGCNSYPAAVTVRSYNKGKGDKKTKAVKDQGVLSITEKKAEKTCKKPQDEPYQEISSVLKDRRNFCYSKPRIKRSPVQLD